MTKQFDNAKDFDYKVFWNIMRKWSKKHIVLISEMDAPHDFKCIMEKSVSRSINPTNKTRAMEKLFIYKYQ